MNWLQLQIELERFQKCPCDNNNDEHDEFNLLSPSQCCFHIVEHGKRFVRKATNMHRIF